jgi:hypothetical protein
MLLHSYHSYHQNNFHQYSTSVRLPSTHNKKGGLTQKSTHSVHRNPPVGKCQLTALPKTPANKQEQPPQQQLVSVEALKRLLDGNDALPPLSSGENECKSKLHTLMSRFGRLMKSNFMDTTNKKTKISPISVPAPPAKRQQMRQVVTPTRASPTTPSRGYNPAVSLSELTIIGTPNSTNNAISEVMRQGLGISPT